MIGKNISGFGRPCYIKAVSVRDKRKSCWLKFSKGSVTEIKADIVPLAFSLTLMYCFEYISAELSVARNFRSFENQNKTKSSFDANERVFRLIFDYVHRNWAEFEKLIRLYLKGT